MSEQQNLATPIASLLEKLDQIQTSIATLQKNTEKVSQQQKEIYSLITVNARNMAQSLLKTGKAKI